MRKKWIKLFPLLIGAVIALLSVVVCDTAK